MVVPLTPPGDLTHFMAVQHLAMQNVAAPDLASFSAYKGFDTFDDVGRASVRGDGVIEYGTDLAATLERMLDDSDRKRPFDLHDPGDVADLIAYKQALFTVMQQNAELLVPAGTDYAGQSHLSGRQGLQDACTDQWCLRNADAYNDQFGLTFAADLRKIDLNQLPGDTFIRDELAWGVDAAEALTRQLAERSGLSDDQILDELNRQDADGKVMRIAGWLLKTEPYDLPKEETERIGAVLDKEFAAIRFGRGDRTGRALVGRLDHAVGEIVQDRQTMSIGLPPPATGTPTVATPRSTTGARTTTPGPGVIRQQ